MKKAILAAVFLSVISPGAAETARTDPQPDIILITVDTLRADHLGVYGYHRDTSPFLDQFASESLVFDRFYAQSSETIPSTGSIMTGFYPHESGATSNSFQLPDEARTLAEILKEKGYATMAVISNGVLQRRSNFHQGFDLFDEELNQRELNRNKAERCAADTTDTAVRLLKSRKDGKFFLWIHYIDPHGAYFPPEESYRSLFTDGIRSKKGLKLNRTGSGHGGIPGYQRLGDQRNPKYYIAQYDGEIRYTDREIGRLFEELKSLGLYDDSLIIFSSDHGEGMGEQDYYFAHGESLQRGLIHLPFFLHWANRTGRTDQPAQQVDIVPTILDAAGIETDLPFRGESLLGKLQGPRDIYSEINQLSSLIRGEYHLTCDAKAKRCGFFDMKIDQDETSNLAGNPTLKPVITGMMTALKTLKEERRVDLPRRHIDFDRQARENLRSLGYVN